MRQEKAQELKLDTLDWQVIADMVNYEHIRGDVYEQLQVSDFDDAMCRTMYNEIRQMEINNQAIDIISLADACPQIPSHAITRMVDMDHSEWSARDHLARIRERASRKALAKMQESVSKMLQGNQPAGQIIEHCMTVFDQVQKRVQFKVQQISQGSADYFDHKCEMAKSNKHCRGLKTGVQLLDLQLSGLNKGNLVILAGRPGHGKSSLALQISLNVAEHEHGTVLFFSQEMPHEEMMDRCVSILGSLDHYQVQNGYLNDENKQKVLQVLNRVENLPLYMDYTPAVTCQHIQNVIRKIRALAGKLDLVVIDHLQKMHHNLGEKGDPKHVRIGATTKQLEQLSKRYQVPVLLLSQLNREIEGRSDTVPVLADLKGSGDIEEDANAVVFVYRPDQNCESAQIIVAKNRGGQVGARDMRFIGKHVRFEELEKKL